MEMCGVHLRYLEMFGERGVVRRRLAEMSGDR